MKGRSRLPNDPKIIVCICFGAFSDRKVIQNYIARCGYVYLNSPNEKTNSFCLKVTSFTYFTFLVLAQGFHSLQTISQHLVTDYGAACTETPLHNRLTHKPIHDSIYIRAANVTLSFMHRIEQKEAETGRVHTC